MGGGTARVLTYSRTTNRCLCNGGRCGGENVFIPGNVSYSTCTCGRTIHQRIQGRFNVKDGRVLVNRVNAVCGVGGRIFLARVFTRVLGTTPGSRLLLTNRETSSKPILRGTGRLKVRGGVVFAKRHDSISQLLRNFSVVVFPSLCRKLPISLVRTRTTGLPYLVSATIAGRITFGGDATFVPLSRPTTG